MSGKPGVRGFSTEDGTCPACGQPESAMCPDYCTREPDSRSPHPARICLRCGHAECPCCPGYCDTMVEVEGEMDMCSCVEEAGYCQYDSERMSPENAAWVDTWCVPGVMTSMDEEGHFTAFKDAEEGVDG